MTDARAEILARLGDRQWRMNNLYTIQDKDGQVVKFVMNESQAQFYQEMWWMNVILKDRQRGFSTFIAMFILDSCLFCPNTQAGVIDISLPDAKKKLDKINFAYLSLPEWLREERPLVTNAKESMEWANGSRVDVSTSHRGGTLQILHVSEYGKIAARKPDTAREIRTGAFNTVAEGNFLFVESTAEGREGAFYDLCDTAQKIKQSGHPLTALDFKFHFFGWWMGTENEMDPAYVTITEETDTYINEKVEPEVGIKISQRKRAWYQKKAIQQGDDMKREFPSTPEEAFESAIDGAYYSKAMARLRSEGRLTAVPYDQGYPVDTFWDLGMDDSMTIWFRQRVGIQNRLIDYLEASGEGFSYYANELNKKAYVYGKHYMPHDIAVRELGTGVSRLEKAEELGIKPIEKVTRPRDIEAVLAGIEAVRTFLSTCLIDEVKCGQGYKCLDNYRKEWDERVGAFRRSPLHNWASHGSDSIRTGAVALKTEVAQMPIPQVKTWRDRLLKHIPGQSRPLGGMVA